MSTTSTRRRAGLAAVATALAIAGSIGLTGPASAAPAPGPGDYIPPLSCGLTRAEIGPLSSLVHRLEPAVRGVRLEYVVHDLNCSAVISLERALQLAPSGPFG